MLTEKRIYPESENIGSFNSEIRKKCFEEVKEFGRLYDAQVWKQDNEKFKGEYCIIACY